MEDDTLHKQASELLKKARTAKVDHRHSEECHSETGEGCTTCHFWSGSIAALGEITGEQGVID